TAETPAAWSDDSAISACGASLLPTALVAAQDAASGLRRTAPAWPSYSTHRLHEGRHLNGDMTTTSSCRRGGLPGVHVLGIKYALEAALPPLYIYVFTDAAQGSHLHNGGSVVVSPAIVEIRAAQLPGLPEDQPGSSSDHEPGEGGSHPREVNILNVDKELADDNNIYDIPVDTTIKQLTISVSGQQGAKN
uniref:Cadherin_C domain-containing protein n=1 Tax=Macrostomum lignano TaxID=282301 RepID=A0A1I8FLW9_9PLAT